MPWHPIGACFALDDDDNDDVSLWLSLSVDEHYSTCTVIEAYIMGTFVAVRSLHMSYQTSAHAACVDRCGPGREGEGAHYAENVVNVYACVRARVK